MPRSLWPALKDQLIAETEALTVGSVEDYTNFTSAVIDDRSFGRLKAALDRAQATDSIEVIAGGTYDDSVGYFVRPTLLLGTDPADEIFCNEYFGPILSVHVYDDANFENVLEQVDSASPYALTGSIIARDRVAVARATEALRFTAGNFYINDKPTGAVVRPAAVRRRPRFGHQRQGRLGREPDALDVAAVDQGNVPGRHRGRVPAPGYALSGRATGPRRRIPKQP